MNKSIKSILIPAYIIHGCSECPYEKTDQFGESYCSIDDNDSIRTTPYRIPDNCPLQYDGYIVDYKE